MNDRAGSFMYILCNTTEDTAQNLLKEQGPKVVNTKQPDAVSIFLTCQLNQRLGINTLTNKCTE
jgi:hypothetical protein